MGGLIVITSEMISIQTLFASPTNIHRILRAYAQIDDSGIVSLRIPKEGVLAEDQKSKLFHRMLDLSQALNYLQNENVFVLDSEGIIAALNATNRLDIMKFHARPKSYKRSVLSFVFKKVRGDILDRHISIRGIDYWVDGACELDRKTKSPSILGYLHSIVWKEGDKKRIIIHSNWKKFVESTKLVGGV